MELTVVLRLVVVIMVRKRRTELPGAGESSESHDTSAGQGGAAQRPPPQQQAQQQQGGGYQQGRGRGVQGPQGQGGQPQGGRGWAPRGGSRGMAPQQYPGGPPDYPQQGRGSQQQQIPRGTAPSQRGGFSGPVYAGGPSMTPTPELHQATQAPQQPGVTMQLRAPYGKPPAEVVHAESSLGSSSSQPVHEAMTQLSVQKEEQHLQVAPASSKSMRFPLRPGKGSLGIRCIVKANHFFAELPDKDLHQYDVSF